MKQHLKDEGHETVTNWYALKLKAADEKHRLANAANRATAWNLIHLIPEAPVIIGLNLNSHR